MKGMFVLRKGFGVLHRATGLAIRHKISTFVLGGAITMLSLVLGMVSPVFATTTGYECTVDGAGLCAFPETNSGQLHAGYKVDAAGCPAGCGGMWRVDGEQTGTVNGPGGNPFTNGSGWNTWYDGDPIVKLSWHADTSLCFQADPAAFPYDGTASGVHYKTCDSSNEHQKWIETCSSCGIGTATKYVNVGDVDDLYSQDPSSYNCDQKSDCSAITMVWYSPNTGFSGTHVNMNQDVGTHGDHWWQF